MTEEQRKLLFEASDLLGKAADRLLGVATWTQGYAAEEPLDQEYPRKSNDYNFESSRNTLGGGKIQAALSADQAALAAYSNLDRAMEANVREALREMFLLGIEYERESQNGAKVPLNQEAQRQRDTADIRYPRPTAEVRYPRPGDHPLDELYREPERTAQEKAHYETSPYCPLCGTYHIFSTGCPGNPR